MAIRVECECGRSFEVAEAFAGKSGKCKGCGARVAVPPPESFAIEPAVTDGPSVFVATPPPPAPKPPTPAPPMVRAYEGKHYFDRKRIDRSLMLGFCAVMHTIGWLSIVLGLMGFVFGVVNGQSGVAVPAIGLGLGGFFAISVAHFLGLLIEIGDNIADMRELAAWTYNERR